MNYIKTEKAGLTKENNNQTSNPCL